MSCDGSFGRYASKVEVAGAEAGRDDVLMNLVAGSTCPLLIRRVAEHMMVRAADATLDLGTGRGRNACLMACYLDEQGQILGPDIGQDMLRWAPPRCQRLPNATSEKKRSMPLQRGMRRL